MWRRCAVFAALFSVAVFTAVAIAADHAALVVKAQNLMKAGKCRDAISLLEKHTGGLNGEDLNVLLELGNAYFLCGNFSKAYDVYRKGFSRKPGSFAFCQGMAHSARKIGRAEEAGRLFEKCASLATSPSFKADMLYAAAASYADAGNPEKVLKLFRQVAKSPSLASTDWLRLYLNTTIDLGMWNEAKTAALVLIDRDPLNADVWQVLAYVCQNQGDPAGVAAAFEVLEKMDQKQRESYQSRLRELYGSLGMWWRLESKKSYHEKGTEDYKREIISFMSLGESEKALSVCDEAYAKTGKSDFLTEKARIFMRLRRFREASEILSNLVQSKPGDLQALVLLAASYINAGEFLKAENVVSDAISYCSVGNFSKPELHSLCSKLMDLQSALSFLVKK